MCLAGCSLMGKISLDEVGIEPSFGPMHPRCFTHVYCPCHRVVTVRVAPTLSAPTRGTRPLGRHVAAEDLPAVLRYGRQASGPSSTSRRKLTCIASTTVSPPLQRMCQKRCAISDRDC